MPKQAPHVRLKSWREAHGYNQKQAADLADMGQGTWSFIERGERTPTLLQAFRLQSLTGGTVKAADWLDARDLRPTG